MLVFTVGLLVVVLLGVFFCVAAFGCEPPIMEEIAAARAAVKLGSAVIAAVAALSVSANSGCGGAWFRSLGGAE